MEYPRTDRNQVKRVPKRAAYNQETIFQIIDAAWICHLGFPSDDGVTVIPMFHARIDDTVIIHGAQSSRLMRTLMSGQNVCVSFALVDGLVLAKSLFHHSMNYRAAVVFGSGSEVTESADKMNALHALSEKAMPGRWTDARQPSELELKATSVVAIKIDTASAKIRTGGPVEEPEDEDLPVWSGVIPMRPIMEEVETDRACSSGLAVPSYVERFRQVNNGAL